MNTLTSNRILEKGDEYFEPKGGKGWTPVPASDIGLQIGFSKYAEVRRPSEQPLIKVAPDEKLAEGFNGRLQIATKPISPEPFGQCAQCNQEFATSEVFNAHLPCEIISPNVPEAPRAEGSLRIKFPHNAEPCSWTGRNGTFKGQAINLHKDTSWDIIKIVPIGKRGAGNCLIEFPTSVIPQIVDWLLRQQK